MGGRGSGWQRKRKTQVEECLILSAARLQSWGVLSAGQQYQGTLTWRDSDGEAIGMLHYKIHADDTTACMYLSEADYNWNGGALLLATSELPWGRRRWWFRCGKGGAGECNRLVDKLYSPLSSPFVCFACRHCHDLSYRSRQTSCREDRLAFHLRRERGPARTPK